jgi:hypothetical protein
MNCDMVMSGLPNDIIFKICRMNKEQKQNEVYKKRHDIMLLQFREYSDEYVDLNNDFGQESQDGSGLVNYLEYFKNGSMRCDARFLEYNDDIPQSVAERIDEWYYDRGLDFEDWCDNYF